MGKAMETEVEKERERERCVARSSQVQAVPSSPVKLPKYMSEHLMFSTLELICDCSPRLHLPAII